MGKEGKKRRENVRITLLRISHGYAEKRRKKEDQMNKNEIIKITKNKEKRVGVRMWERPFKKREHLTISPS